MRNINVHCAAPIGNNVVEKTTINIYDSFNIPDGASLFEHDEAFERDAQLLFDALRTSLPGGTLDRLMCKLMYNRASHFKVLL
jgi:hypothetical protein